MKSLLSKLLIIFSLVLVSPIIAPTPVENKKLTEEDVHNYLLSQAVAKIQVLSTAYYKPAKDQKRYFKGSYRKERRFNGTGITFTGNEARIGTIAADLKVLPLGTVVYIPNYGKGVVDDVGGRIKGKRIDVFMGEGDDGLERSLEWGAKKMEIHILRWGGQNRPSFFCPPAAEFLK